MWKTPVFAPIVKFLMWKTPVLAPIVKFLMLKKPNRQILNAKNPRF
jgi:hypothetical protein